jgi:hypothetical protein
LVQICDHHGNMLIRQCLVGVSRETREQGAPTATTLKIDEPVVLLFSSPHKAFWLVPWQRGFPASRQLQRPARLLGLAKRPWTRDSPPVNSLLHSSASDLHGPAQSHSRTGKGQASTAIFTQSHRFYDHKSPYPWVNSPVQTCLTNYSIQKEYKIPSQIILSLSKFTKNVNI